MKMSLHVHGPFSSFIFIFFAALLMSPGNAEESLCRPDFSLPSCGRALIKTPDPLRVQAVSRITAGRFEEKHCLAEPLIFLVLFELSEAEGPVWGTPG